MSNVMDIHYGILLTSKKKKKQKIDVQLAAWQDPKNTIEKK